MMIIFPCDSLCCGEQVERW